MTKLDLMDEGTDYLDALTGQLYKLKLGYIGVVCRRQKDLDAGKDIKQAILDEQVYRINRLELT